MLKALARKGRQVATDRVLRRYLLARMLCRLRPIPTFTPHLPPYWGGPVALSAVPAFTLAPTAIGGEVRFTLHGRSFTVDATDPGRLFEQPHADLETRLALHRFAWLPLYPDADPATVAALWRAWFARYGDGDDGWAWHPYTTAERAVALLDFTERHGWPGGDAQVLLARHVDAIQNRLEYFGEHHTGNHLANNGRGLAQLGLRLGDEGVAEAGLRILVEEARRIFLPSGVLREDSSHYHLLYAARYAEMAALAATHGRPEAVALSVIAARALAIVPHLTLPGGLPLIGDISPDLPPDRLQLPPLPASADGEALRRDGWLRFDAGEWAGLWHAAVEGWSHMPGHGHQDCGSAELHWRGHAVFVDLGRGAYGADGEAAFYHSAAVHNGLTVDDCDPYPANRPYYDDAFRRVVGGPPPALAVDGGDAVVLAFAGYGRIGAPRVSRRWRLTPALAIEDDVQGRGRHRIVRRLHTALPVMADGACAAIIDSPAGRLRVASDAPLRLERRTRWVSYGEGIPATAIVAEVDTTLPWRGHLTVEVA